MRNGNASTGHQQPNHQRIESTSAGVARISTTGRAAKMTGRDFYLAAGELCLPGGLPLGDLALALLDVALHLALLHDAVLNVRVQSLLELPHEPVHHRLDPQTSRPPPRGDPRQGLPAPPLPFRPAIDAGHRRSPWSGLLGFRGGRQGLSWAACFSSVWALAPLRLCGGEEVGPSDRDPIQQIRFIALKASYIGLNDIIRSRKYIS
jgi:hypothetical protein